MTNRLSFELEKATTGHVCYVAMAARLTNFLKGFSNPVDTFSSNIESLWKR